MKELKVYGGMAYNRNTNNHERCVIATYSLKDVSRIMGRRWSIYQLKKYWCITGNDEEIRIAKANPNIPIYMGKLY